MSKLANEGTPGITAEQFLAEVSAPAKGPLKRRPDDGWIRADPWPMGQFGRQALRGVIKALIPPPPAPSPPDIVDRLEHYARFTMAYMPRMNARGVVILFWLLEFSPIWRFQGLRRLSRLPHLAAAEVLTGLTHSRLMVLRQLMLAVKGLVLPGYFDQDEVHEALGYSPVPFISKRVAFRQRLKKMELPNEDDTMGPHSVEIRP